MWTAILGALGFAVSVSHPIMGFNSVFCFGPSLNLFSGYPMLRALAARSDKTTIFERLVSSIRTICQTSRSLGFMMSASMHGMLALQQFCVGDSIFPGDAHNLAKAGDTDLVFFCIAAKFHSHRAGTGLCTCRLVPKVMPCSSHTRVHNLPKEAPALASLFETSLSILQLG